MAKSDNTIQEDTSINKEEVLKSLTSSREKLSKLESTRELSLALHHLDNAIYWLKEEV